MFDRKDDSAASAQAGAFRDTWRWGDEGDKWSYQELMKFGGETARFVAALRAALKESDTMAYLAMMAVRLQELHKKLKPTGALYLHCDPSASHYLKVVLDGVFGPRNFLNEVIWKRTSSHNSGETLWSGPPERFSFMQRAMNLFGILNTNHMTNSM